MSAKRRDSGPFVSPEGRDCEGPGAGERRKSASEEDEEEEENVPDDEDDEGEDDDDEGKRGCRGRRDRTPVEDG